MRREKLLKGLGYGAFGFAALLFFLYVSFPARAVGQYLTYQLRKASDGKLDIDFEDASMYRFTGVSVEQVAVRIAQDRGDPIEVNLDALKARIRLLPLFLLRVSATAVGELGDGSIEGVVTKKGDELGLSVDIDELDLGSQPILTKLIELPIKGKLSGKGELSLALASDAAPPAGGRPRIRARSGSPVDLAQSEAELTLELDGASLGPGAIKGFTIPAPLSLGSIDTSVKLQNGRLEIASFEQKGGQIALDAELESSLRGSLRSSRLDTCIKVKLADQEYLSRHPKINTALQLAEVRFNKDGQGFLHVKLGGTFTRPRLQRGLCGASARPARRR